MLSDCTPALDSKKTKSDKIIITAKRLAPLLISAAAESHCVVIPEGDIAIQFRTSVCPPKLFKSQAFICDKGGRANSQYNPSQAMLGVFMR